MNLEDYVKQEFEELKRDVKEVSDKVDNLVIALAVIKAAEAKKAKYTASMVAVVVSVSSSTIMFLLQKVIGG